MAGAARARDITPRFSRDATARVSQTPVTPCRTSSTKPSLMARERNYQPLYADSDSDPEGNSENEATPKGKPAKSKKRVSDVYDPNSANAHRVPFKNVNLNDDAAEKRKRRKSAKLAQPLGQMIIDDPPVQDSTGGSGETPKAARHLKHKQQLLALTEAPIISVPLDVMSSNFEEWMKMATDNVCKAHLRLLNCINE